MDSRSIAPSASFGGGDYGLGVKGDNDQGAYHSEKNAAGVDPETGEPQVIISQPVTKVRRVWIAIVWILTFWIPSFVLDHVARRRRADVRIAWREKLVLVFFIFMLNAAVVFYIIEFGALLCPNYDKAFNELEVSYHQGDDDFWVSIHGQVFDISKFWRIQHSDGPIKTTPELMQTFSGQDLSEYFPPPLTLACPGLVTDERIMITPNTSVTNVQALHASGPLNSPDPTVALDSIDWYFGKFRPRIAEYYRGDLVVTQAKVLDQGQNQQQSWVVINNKIYDLTDYFYTTGLMNNLAQYHFLDPVVESIVQNNAGMDVTDMFFKSLNKTAAADNLRCLNQAFYAGTTDFRKSARCQANNYILLGFTIILCTVILTKFLSALQFGSRRKPVAQDKFVICAVPAYTEGEDQLRKSLDSLTALSYDNKRKLICVICDGNIVGEGNDRPTPKIVLDILGVDPRIDPPALPFKSIGTGSEQLNYGKVYSGLYEFEGNVVPYLVVVKLGKESEQTKAKPGNRGKRDSQVLLLSFLNRVHHRSPMSPLELEMFHQIVNVIGIDPEQYSFMLQIDADTSVREDSLNQLVAQCSSDAKIAGICGETSLENEERSWWTMIQVYEYYISHHLAKAFESLFGSVTCLPGCFCMYRLRSQDKGKPLIISDKVIREYADGNVNTLHKQNLLSLGEDRYLTTLMMKHFPEMSYKFNSGAYAKTAAPESWSVLLSQRRRWINSTIHNLAELVFIKEMCGFCCFSMRFVVFIDLFGTLILPATCAYLIYLIYKVATHSGQFPLISLIMIGAVYGLQALVFILKRQWQHIGWMVIYIMAFPFYSVILPIYSFWHQDDVSWGSTRIVVGEKGDRQLVAVEDEGFDPRSIPLQTWSEYAVENGLPSARGDDMNSGGYDGLGGSDQGRDMEDFRSMYSQGRAPSTVLSGFGDGRGPYMHMQTQDPAPPSPTYHSLSQADLLGHRYQSPTRSTSQLGLMHQRSEYSPSRPLSQYNLGNLDNPPPRPLSQTMQFGSSMPMNRPSYLGSTTNLDRQSVHSNMQLPENPLGSMYQIPTPTGSTFTLPPMQPQPQPHSQLNPHGSMFFPSASQPDLLQQQQRHASFAGSLTAPIGFQERGSRPHSIMDFQRGMGPTEDTMAGIVREVLGEVDLERVTKKQVRALVEQRLQGELSKEQRAFVDGVIDRELLAL